jgi:uracil-DNA glycosylase
MAAELLKAYKPGLRLNNVAPYFAHINAAKCCQNKAGHAQADAILFRNCSEYIGGELKILRPDVLVTQGRYALTAVEQALQERKISSLRPLTWITSQKGAYGILAIGGRKVLWFATPHPQARGRIFQSQRERYWEKWSSMVGDLELVLKGAS